jgi:hypothetical protein
MPAQVQRTAAGLAADPRRVDLHRAKDDPKRLI